MKYVRCNFCDSGITIDQVRTFELNKVKGVKHEYVFFKCPACGYDVKSFIFNEEILTSDKSNYEASPKLPSLDSVRYEVNKVYNSDKSLIEQVYEVIKKLGNFA